MWCIVRVAPYVWRHFSTLPRVAWMNYITKLICTFTINHFWSDATCRLPTVKQKETWEWHNCSWSDALQTSWKQLTLISVCLFYLSKSRHSCRQKRANPSFQKICVSAARYSPCNLRPSDKRSWVERDKKLASKKILNLCVWYTQLSLVHWKFCFSPQSLLVLFSQHFLSWNIRVKEGKRRDDKGKRLKKLKVKRSRKSWTCWWMP